MNKVTQGTAFTPPSQPVGDLEPGTIVLLNGCTRYFIVTNILGDKYGISLSSGLWIGKVAQVTPLPKGTVLTVETP
jgi:hypothetical protein